MKKKFLLLILALSLGAQEVFAASGSGNISSVQNYGGAVNSNFPAKTLPSGDHSTVTLVSGIASSSSGNFLQFQGVTVGATSAGQYRVGAGRTLHLDGAYVTNVSTTTAYGFAFCYSTAPLASHNTGTVPAGIQYLNPVGSATAAAIQSGGFQIPKGVDPLTPVWIPLNVEFGSNTYPCWMLDSSNANVKFQAYGYEY